MSRVPFAIDVEIGLRRSPAVEFIGSRGEFNDLIGRLLGEAWPAVDLPHYDLP
jgi:hypothetical protein